jgi:hypothetical protein
MVTDHGFDPSFNTTFRENEAKTSKEEDRQS